MMRKLNKGLALFDFRGIELPYVRYVLCKLSVCNRGREKYLRYFEVFLEGKNTQSTQKNTWNFY